MWKVTTVILAVLPLLSACQTKVPPDSGWVRLDGKIMPIGSAQEKQFWVDRAICLPRHEQGRPAWTVLSSGNIFVEVDNESALRQEAGTVMLGCMAQKGYQLRISDQFSLK